MYLKLIACSIFQRELCHILVNTPHVVDVEFIEIGEHKAPERLRTLLQSRVDGAQRARQWGSGISRDYDALLLAYGICGNAIAGLRASRVPIVIPRAHDCATLLLGSREEFLKHFGYDLSHPFGSVGYYERGYNNCLGADDGRPVNDPEYEKHVAEYGEENARYIWDVMHPPVHDGYGLFISTPPTRGLPAEESFRTEIEREGLAFKELSGSIRMLERLVNGPWDEDDFLVVQPEETVKTIYDQVKVIEARRKD